MSPPRSVHLLQLLPPRLDDQTASLADSAFYSATSLSGDNVDADSEVSVDRRTVLRGLWDAARLRSVSFDYAAALHAVGPAVWACIGVRVPLVYSPLVLPTRSDLAALRLISRNAPLVGVAPSPHSAAMLRQRGIRWSRIHVIPPTAALPPRRLGRNDVLRERLGYSPSDRVVLALGDCTRTSGHDLALWSVAILALTDLRWKFLVTGAGPGMDRLHRFAAAIAGDARSTPLMTVAREELPDLRPDHLLSACDVAVYAPSGPAQHQPLLHALAAEVPLVSTRTPITTPLLPDSLLLDDPRPRALARRLAELAIPPATALQGNLEIVAGMAARLRQQDPATLWATLWQTVLA